MILEVLNVSFGTTVEPAHELYVVVYMASMNPSVQQFKSQIILVILINA